MTSVALWNNYPLEYYGGGEVVALQLLPAIRGAGYSTGFYADASFQRPERVPTGEILRLAGDIDYRKVPFQQYGSYLPKRLFRSFPPVSALEQHGANLVFVDRPPPSQFLADLAKSPASRHTVLLLHGISIERLRYLPPSLLPYQTYLRAMLGGWRSIPSEIRLLTLTASLRDYLVRHGHPPKNVRVIPNGVETRHYSVARNDATFDIVYVGLMDRRMKGVDLLRQAVRTLSERGSPGIRFHLVGSGPDEDLIRPLHNGSTVFCPGFLAEAEKRALLSRANAMIVCSRVEPFGLVVLEGLASGLPVISTPAAGPAEILGHGPDLGKVVAPSPIGLADGLLDLHRQWLSAKEEYFTRKLARRNMAEEVFPTRAMVGAYLGLVSDLEEGRSIDGPNSNPDDSSPVGAG